MRVEMRFDKVIPEKPVFPEKTSMFCTTLGEYPTDESWSLRVSFSVVLYLLYLFLIIHVCLQVLVWHLLLVWCLSESTFNLTRIRESYLVYNRRLFDYVNEAVDG